MVASAFLAKRAGPARVVGVAFDDHRLHAVEVQRRTGRNDAEIRRAGAANLTPGLVTQGEITDGEAFASELRKLWTEHGFGTKNVAVGLDGRAVVIRQADLPALDGEEVAQAAAYDIGELLSYPLDDAVVSTVEISRYDREGREMVRTLTLAARQASLLDLRAAVRSAGLHPVRTELEASALAAAVSGRAPTEPDRVDDREPGGASALVHVSRNVTLVVVHDEEGLEFSRVVTAGVDIGETSLSDELEMELAVLAGFTTGEADGVAGGEGTGTGPGIATVVDGVRRTLHYYTTEVGRRPVDRIVLCGPQSEAGGLADAIGASVPDAEILGHEFGRFPTHIEDVSSYDTAASVGIAAVNGVTTLRRFDLVPQVVKQRRSSIRRTVAGLVLAAIVAPMLIADAIGRRSATGDEAVEADAVELTVETLRAELAEFDDEKVLRAEAEEASERIDALHQQEYGFTTLLRRVAESMPEDTFLISFRLGRSTSGEVPVGYAGEPPPATFALTGVAADLDGVGRWMQTVDDVPAVDGLWMTQSAFGPYGATEQIAAIFTVDGAVTGPAEPTDRLDVGP